MWACRRRFRLPSAIDNRPLKFDEFEQVMGHTLYTSATPGPYEMAKADQIVEQIIRPTGLVDPEVDVRPIRGQVDDLLKEIRDTQRLIDLQYEIAPQRRLDPGNEGGIAFYASAMRLRFKPLIRIAILLAVCGAIAARVGATRLIDNVQVDVHVTKI